MWLKVSYQLLKLASRAVYLSFTNKEGREKVQRRVGYVAWLFVNESKMRKKTISTAKGQMESGLASLGVPN